MITFPELFNSEYESQTTISCWILFRDYSQEQIIEILEKRSDIDVNDITDSNIYSSLLVYAALSEPAMTDVAKYLINRGANLFHASKKDGNDIALSIADTGNIEMFELICSNFQLDKNYKCEDVGGNYYHWAGSVEIIEYLVTNEFPGINELNNYGYTPIAFSNYDLDKLKALIKYGADLNKIVKYNKSKCTLLDICEKECDDDIVEYLILQGAKTYSQLYNDNLK